MGDTVNHKLTEAEVNAVMDRHLALWAECNAKGDATALLEFISPQALAITDYVPPYMYQDREGIYQWWRNVNDRPDIKDTRITKFTQDRRRIRIFGDTAVAQAHFSAAVVLPNNKGHFVEQGLETVVIKAMPSGPKIIALHLCVMGDEKAAKLLAAFPGT